MEQYHGEGKITDEVLNAACRRVLLPKFQMRVFEHPYCDVALDLENPLCYFGFGLSNAE